MPYNFSFLFALPPLPPLVFLCDCVYLQPQYDTQCTDIYAFNDYYHSFYLPLEMCLCFGVTKFYGILYTFAHHSFHTLQQTSISPNSHSVRSCLLRTRNVRCVCFIIILPQKITHHEIIQSHKANKQTYFYWKSISLQHRALFAISNVRISHCIFGLWIFLLHIDRCTAMGKMCVDKVCGHTGILAPYSYMHACIYMTSFFNVNL